MKIKITSTTTERLLRNTKLCSFCHEPLFIAVNSSRICDECETQAVKRAKSIRMTQYEIITIKIGKSNENN
mgnify:CR=1 FL=1